MDCIEKSNATATIHREGVGKFSSATYGWIVTESYRWFKNSQITKRSAVDGARMSFVTCKEPMEEHFCHFFPQAAFLSNCLP
jgi:hypothetical protein